MSTEEVVRAEQIRSNFQYPECNIPVNNSLLLQNMKVNDVRKGYSGIPIGFRQ